MKNKVTIVGAGMVGSTAAYSLIMNGVAEEIAIIDINEKLVASQVMDLAHSVPFVERTRVKVGTYADCADSAVAVITCGAAQKEGETRLDLVEKNAKIIKEIVPQIFAANPDIVIVMVTNPVDVLTQIAIDQFPDKKWQIMGSGTMLDSARLRHLLAEELGVNPKSIHAYMIGEHGDTEFPLWSTAAVGNMHLGTCRRLSEQEKDHIFQEAKNAAYTIIEGKQATYYAVGAACSDLIDAIMFDKRTVLPVSHYMDGDDPVEGVCLSLPAIVGREGIMGKLCVELNNEEHKLLEHSANTLKKAVDQVSEKE